jgi:hypothetical protein
MSNRDSNNPEDLSNISSNSSSHSQKFDLQLAVVIYSDALICQSTVANLSSAPPFMYKNQILLISSSTFSFRIPLIREREREKRCLLLSPTLCLPNLASLGDSLFVLCSFWRFVQETTTLLP